MTTLEYFKRLALELRQRRLSEEQTTDVLRELQSHLQETGERPEETFGSPKEYAARFPKGSTVSNSFIYLAATTVLTAILIGWSNALQRKLPEQLQQDLIRQG